MDPLRTGARLLSRGMRGGNPALTFLGAVLAARGIMRWLDRPEREVLYSKRLKPGERIQIAVVQRDKSPAPSRQSPVRTREGL